MSVFTFSTAKKKAQRAVSALAVTLMLGAVFITSFSLTTESTLAVRSQCTDGIDNDGNGIIDYPQDTGCVSLDDNYEGTTTEGNFIELTDGKDTIAPSGALVYVITLKQQRDTSRNVDVVLDLPHQSNITSASDGGSTGIDQVKWTNVSVYKNVTRTLTVHINVRPDATEGQYLVARARTTGSTAIDTTLVQGYVPTQGDQYAVSVTDGKEFILPGANNTYTVRVRNISSTAKTTDVHLALPYDSYFVSASDNGVRSSFDVTWKNVTLAPNEQKSFSATIQIDPRIRNNIILRTKAYAGSVNALDQTVARVGLPYDAIKTSITDGRSMAPAGQVLTYTVRVTNTADIVATSVPVSASLPQYGEFVGATEGGYWDGTNVRWLVLQIAPHDTRTLTYSVRVRADAPMGATLVASIVSPQTGTASRDTTTVGSRLVSDSRIGTSSNSNTSVAFGDTTNMTFRKTADRGEAVPGGRIRYTLFVRNTMNTALTDGTIVDRFDPQYLTLDTYQHPEALASQNGGNMIWNIPVLQPGESWQTSYVLLVSKNAPTGVNLDNVASIRGTGLSSLSLTETVRTNTSGVLGDFPATGAGMDTILALVMAGMAVLTSGVQRKVLMGRLF